MLPASSTSVNAGNTGCGQPCAPQALCQHSDFTLQHRRFDFHPTYTVTTVHSMQAASSYRAASCSIQANLHTTHSVIGRLPSIPGRQVSPWLRIGEALPARAPRCLEAMARSFG